MSENKFTNWLHKELKQQQKEKETIMAKAIKKDEGVKEHKGDKPHKHPHEEKEVEEGKVVFDDHDADDKDFIKLIKKHGLKAKSDGEDTTVTGSPDKIEKVLQTMYGNDWKDMYTRKGQNFENFAGKEVKEYYEIGTDEYRDHTLEVTPGQSLTWGSANAFKVASMKEALAKVWGLDEKKLDKTEEDDKIAPVKGKKTMTGGDVAEVEVDPEKKEK